jgi:hypothetical protein
MVSRLMVIILFVWFATAGLLMVRLTTSFDISSSRFITEPPGIAVITDEKVLVCIRCLFFLCCLDIKIEEERDVSLFCSRFCC